MRAPSKSYRAFRVYETFFVSLCSSIHDSIVFSNSRLVWVSVFTGATRVSRSTRNSLCARLMTLIDLSVDDILCVFCRSVSLTRVGRSDDDFALRLRAAPER